MIDEFEAVLFGNLLLTTLDGLIEEFNDLATFETHHVIVVLLLRQLEQCMTTIEIVADYQTSRLELGKHSINRGKADVFACIEQGLIYIFSTKMVLSRRVLEDLEYLDARQGHLQTRLAQFMVLIGHGCSSQ